MAHLAIACFRLLTFFRAFGPYFRSSALLRHNLSFKQSCPLSVQTVRFTVYSRPLSAITISTTITSPMRPLG